MGKRPKRRTKIVATIGPSSKNRETIRGLIEAGMNVARLNFSHGTHQEHSESLAMLREESAALGQHIAVFQDLGGPKLRITKLKGGSCVLQPGEMIELKYAPKGDEDEVEGDEKTIYTGAFDPTVVLREGERTLLADGRIELVTEKVTSESAQCRVWAGGPLRSRSGISVPESNLTLSSLTQKDREDLVWAVANSVDYVALSFVGSSQDIADVTREIESLHGSIPIIAKIERASSLDDIQAIVNMSGAVMVARGDLGLELPLERVPSAQRLIINTANFAGAPVITATQMLMSMVNEIRPTRAEVTDVTTAVRDGTDAVMLSDETAIGKYPVEAVRVLNRILEQAESELNYERHRPTLRAKDQSKVADAICYAACNAAEKIAASAMIACTKSGYTARLMAKYRPLEPLFGVTSEKKSLARMSLFWGVQPVLVDVSEGSSIESEIVAAMASVRDEFGLKPGSRVVITAGLRTGHSGSTNVMEIREIPRA